MAFANTEKRWTYEDYRQLPEDGNRYEIIDERLYVNPAPLTPHQKVLSRLIVLLSPLEVEGRISFYPAPTDLFLPGATPVQPDVIVLTPEQFSFVHQNGIHGVPTLVIEVLSRRTAAYDRTVKLHKYASSGIRHYWLVDWLDRTIEALSLRPSGLYELTASVGPGEHFVPHEFTDLEIDVDALFAGLPRGESDLAGVDLQP